MKKILLSIAMLCMALGGRAETQSVCEGWPADYGGVMLQGFWWDGYEDAKWTALTARANELSQYFDLIWVPNSGSCSMNPDGSQGKSMGYDPCWWLRHNSCFGTEAELRTMINTYKAKGVGIIEDVVINHKKGKESWCDFPDEPWEFNGQTYNITWSGAPDYNEITRNDDCNFPGSGYSTKGYYDTGDDFPGFRDLDHTSERTRDNVKIYLNYLLKDLGYTGFRYDMVKGYAAQYIQEYNNATNPQFSVGEYWADQQGIENWINGTGKTSAAFDFQLKFNLNKAISNNAYSELQWKSFTYNPAYSRYSITFVDNHDTGREDQYMLKNNWSAANAFILASPGTPCIWYPHYLADPVNIRAMILARKACGITNTNCDVLQQYATDYDHGYVMESVGSKGSVFVLLGEAAYTQEGIVSPNYKLVASGDAYKFYSTKADFAYVTVSPDGGTFTDETLNVTLTPVNAQSNKAWYRIGDGAEELITGVPIAISATVNNSVTINWRAVGGDDVEHTGSATFTRRNSYPEPEVSEGEVCVFYETDAEPVTIWTWDDDDEHYSGYDWNTKDEMALQGVNNAGKLVYKWTCTATNGSPTKVIFDYGSGQTATLPFVNTGYYNESGLVYHQGTNVVYFDNSVGHWNEVYYHAFDSNHQPMVGWPGTKITTTDSRGFFQVTLDGTYPNIIFNDGTEEGSIVGLNQTENLVAVNKEVYQLGSKTVSFDKGLATWDKVYCYAYMNEQVHNAGWPGVEVHANQSGLYEVALPDAYAYVIFNNGDSDNPRVGIEKTEDLNVVDGMVYTLGSNKVSYDNTYSKWENVYGYAFTSELTPKVAWPGELLTPNAEGKFELTLPDVFKYVVFNDGKGGVVGVTQTKDLAATDGAEYVLNENTVYYNNRFSNWDEVYYYAYTDKKEYKTGWPGEKLEANAEGLYEVTLIEGYSNVIFNSGKQIGSIVGVDQTEDLVVENDNIYAVLAKTVYFKNSLNWEQVYYYTYNSNEIPMTGWPGEVLQANDNDLFEITLPEGYTTVIFNNGNSGNGNQTPNLEVVDGRIYDASGNSFVTVYFDNSASGWNDVYCFAKSGEGNNETWYMGPWPGTKITEKDYETASGGFYKAVIPSQAEKVLFNAGNGQPQTKDYKLKDGSIYNAYLDESSEGYEYQPIDKNSLFFSTCKMVEGFNVVKKVNGIYTCDNLVLSDGKTFETPYDFTAYGVSYVREVTDGQLWGTICMPFDLTSNEMVQYYTLSSVTSEEMVFSPQDEIPANTPAVYNLLEEEPYCLDIWYMRPLEISATNGLSLSSAPISGWTMKGTYSPVETLVSHDDINIYYISLDQVWRAKKAVPMNPFRAWFETSTTISPAKLRIAIEGEAESIESVEMDKNQGEIIFDLMGRQSDSSRKGIVIKNGKVVFVK